MTLLSKITLWLAHLSWRSKLFLALLVLVLTMELIVKRIAPRSRFYRGWSKAIETLGAFWTAIILAFIYFVAVGPIGLIMRFTAKDPLDRKIEPHQSRWKAHEPNPLGPEAAARHQF
jgi:hypothetical protein